MGIVMAEESSEEDLFYDVLKGSSRDNPELTHRLLNDDQGNIQAYGVSIGGLTGRGVFLKRLDEQGESVSFDVYQFSGVNSMAVKPERLPEHIDPNNVEYVIRHSTIKLPTSYLQLNGEDPSEGKFASEVLRLYNEGFIYLQDASDHSNRYVWPPQTDELPETLKALAADL